MAKNLFLDTNVLLTEDVQKINQEDKIFISNVTLNELEAIKIAYNKDEAIKFRSREALRWLEKNKDRYTIVIYNEKMNRLIKKYGLVMDADAQIIACALSIAKELKDLTFVTRDLSCRTIAEMTGLNVGYTFEKREDYKGYKEVSMNEMEMSQFYASSLHDPSPQNKYDLLENEYLLIKDASTDEIVDKYVWREGKYEAIPYITLESRHFDKLQPRDVYQELCLESLSHNQFTILRGGAGSGKSLISLSYGFRALEKGEVNKIVIVCNPIAVRGAARLGFLPGSKDEKLLDSQVGNILISKLGSRLEVERLIDDGELDLIPLSDLRGYDTTGMKCFYYITESQNMSKDMMKLALQRIGEDSKVVVEGDDLVQVDDLLYAGNNNGLRRAVEVFKGHPIFGTVTLKNIHRSEIARIADEIC